VTVVARLGPLNSRRLDIYRPMNLTPMARDTGVGGLGIESPSPLGGPRCCLAATTGDLLTTGRSWAQLRRRARYFHYQNSVFFGFTSDFSTLRSVEAAQGEISVQKMMGVHARNWGCVIAQPC
jgi:hypothetical protein